MKKLSSLAGAAAMLFASPALAADAAAKPDESGFSWRGFYLGLYAGYSWGAADTSGTLDPDNPFGISSPNAQPAYNGNMSPSLKPTGFTGGGAIGANWQSGAVVWGLEGDFGAFNLSSSATTSVTPPGGHSPLTSGTTASADWLGTVRGRVGWAFDRSLFYVTGGAAFASTSLGQTNTYTSLGPAVENFSVTNVRIGLAAGGGWEYSFAPNWSGKVEYLHLDFSTLNGAGLLAVQTVSVAHSATFTAEVARAGINYRFGQ